MNFFFIIEETGEKEDLVFLSFDRKAALSWLNEMKEAKISQFGPQYVVERPHFRFAVACPKTLQETEYSLKAIELDLTKTFAELGKMNLEFSFNESLLYFLLINFGVAVIEDDKKEEKPNTVSADEAISRAVNSPDWNRGGGSPPRSVD